MEDLWTSKYMPRKASEVVGNRDAVASIRSWLKGFAAAKNASVPKGSNPSASIIVCGPHGVGKSIAVKLLLEELGYEMKYLSSPNIKHSKVLKEVLQPCTSNLHLVFEDGGASHLTKRPALVIDDSETITLTSEKTILLQVFKDNEAKKMFPLIFLTNEQHSKLVSDIKKSCPEVRFRNPRAEELVQFMHQVCKKEGMVIKDQDTIGNILRFSQSDVRRMLLILQDLKLTYGEGTIGPEEWKKYTSSSQKKDKDIGLFEATRKILDNYRNMDTCLQLYETEKVLLPLMVFENYPRNVMARDMPNSNTLLKTMKDITNSISVGDVIETNIYTDQNWYLQNLHGFYTCVETSFLLNKHKKRSSELQHIDFSSDLNKTSLKNINKKNIISVQAALSDKNITDLLYLNKIIHHNVKAEALDMVKGVATQYGLSTKLIEIMMKIDKSLEKINITTKNKKFLQAST
jgi:replication factor C subunit 1